MTAITKVIRILLGFTALSDGDLVFRGQAVQKGLTGNAAYPATPVDLTTFNAALVSLAAYIAAALDGGKAAVAAKNKQRQVVVQMLRQLAIYVEVASNNDVAVFATSGFVAASSTRTPAQPLTQPVVRKIEQGLSGQLLITITGIPGARSYTLRYAPLNGGTPGAWTEQTITSVRPRVSINNLTPGTTYAFQVCALGKLGLTAWSDSITRMSI